MTKSVTAEDQYFDSAGVRIRYIDDGDGSPVLLLHGFTRNIGRWIDAGLFQGLVAAGYRVIAYDGRGHGKSDTPQVPEMYGIEMAQDALRLLDHLGIERAHIVGYSMGAKITAKIGELHPDRALTLTLGGVGIPFWAPKALTAEQIGQIMSKRVDTGEICPQAIAAITQSYREFLPDEAALSDIRTPTLVVVGDNDRGLDGSDNRTEGAQRLATTMPDARYALVPGNHIEALTEPAFLAELIQFLGDHSSACD